MGQKKMISLSNCLKWGLILVFPLRDAIGFQVGDIPIRLGEIVSALFVLLLLSMKYVVNKKEYKIELIVILNLVLVLLGIFVSRGQYDVSFATKYIIRNILNIIFVGGFLVSSIDISDNEIEFLMKYIVITEVIAFIILYTTRSYLYMGEIQTWEDIIKTGQYITLGGVQLPRFVGTASEPGYLTTLLPIPLFYFLNSTLLGNVKRYKYYFLITLLLCVFTFSSAVYVASAFVLLYGFIRNKKVNYKKLALLIIGLVIVFIILTNIPSVNEMLENMVFKKISSFLGGRSDNWSANERTTQYKKAWNYFRESNVIQLFIGHGTGGYLYHTTVDSTGLLTNTVEEAFNIYLSTLTDRGILGLIIIICGFFTMKKYVIKKNVGSLTIGIGLFIQLLHWMITGNMWLNYFWIEVVLLIGIYRFSKRKNGEKNEKKDGFSKKIVP